MTKNSDDYNVFVSLMNLLNYKWEKGKNARFSNYHSSLIFYYLYFRNNPNIDLIKYLYCYLYTNFDELVDSDIYFDGDSICILSINNNDKKTVCKLEKIRRADDEELTISKESDIVTFDRKSNKKHLSKTISYNTPTAIEMISLESDSVECEEDDNIFKLFDRASELECARSSFRDFDDLLFVTEVDIVGPKVRHFESDVGDIATIKKSREVTLDEYRDSSIIGHQDLRNRIAHRLYSYPDLMYEHILFYKYFDSVLGKDLDNSYYSNVKEYEKVDNDIEKFIKDNKITDLSNSYDAIMEKLENRGKDGKLK